MPPGQVTIGGAAGLAQASSINRMLPAKKLMRRSAILGKRVFIRRCFPLSLFLYPAGGPAQNIRAAGQAENDLLLAKQGGSVKEKLGKISKLSVLSGHLRNGGPVFARVGSAIINASGEIAQDGLAATDIVAEN